ncbi:hypothetical protein [Chryseobacterium sp.]|uniref:hypothetical protein n=1 Tax=Chryseobacterium sp. TaxID=1871047 RepID=UPI00388D2972
MNKKAVIFLLSMCFLPLIIFFGYFFIESLMDNRTRKEIYLEKYKKDFYNFKVDTIFRDNRNHNAMTLKGKDKYDIETLTPEWEYSIFQKGDSIVKEKGSLKIYLYRDKKLDTILDYNNIYIREN